MALKAQSLQLELDGALTENTRLERYYQTIKAAYEETKTSLAVRNQEFVEWRKGIAAQIYKDFTQQ